MELTLLCGSFCIDPRNFKISKIRVWLPSRTRPSLWLLAPVPSDSPPTERLYDDTMLRSHRYDNGIRFWVHVARIRFTYCNAGISAYPHYTPLVLGPIRGLMMYIVPLCDGQSHRRGRHRFDRPSRTLSQDGGRKKKKKHICKNKKTRFRREINRRHLLFVRAGRLADSTRTQGHGGASYCLYCLRCRTRQIRIASTTKRLG